MESETFSLGVLLKKLRGPEAESEKLNLQSQIFKTPECSQEVKYLSIKT